MNVFARWRPLVGAEANNGTIAHNTTTNDKTSLLSVSIAKQSSSSQWKSSNAFNAVLNSDDDNSTAYKTIVEPAVPHIMQGGNCSFFAYGHSGSGKTHTVIGYKHEDITDVGICLATAAALFAEIDIINQQQDQQHPQLAIGFSAFELRQKSAFDLLNNSVECHIREGPDGKVHIRGETEMLDGGKVRVRPIVKLPCWTYEFFKTQLLEALARRSIGSSSIHDQSSRTHAVIELEIVSMSLIKAREALIERQSELVPVGKNAADISIEETLNSRPQDESGKWVPKPGYQLNQARIDEAEAEKAKFEARVTEAEQLIESIYKTSPFACLGGRVVFVDLAGAEYQVENAATMASQLAKQSPTEKQQARQINTDLLALKEVFRAWAANQKRIPFRSSPLTMVLRETFTAPKHRGSSMIVTVSPSNMHYSATLNSLKYGSLMGSVKA